MIAPTGGRSAAFGYDIASQYEAYYDSPAGRRIDELERDAVLAVLSVLGTTPRGRLIEVGCGTGHWTRWFASVGFDVVPTDASLEMLAIARRLDPDRRYLHARAEKLPALDNEFPIVAAIAVLEFVADAGLAVGEISRVLAPGGLFIGGFLTADSHLAAHRDSDPVIAHATLRTEAELIDLLRPIGEVVAIERCVRFSPTMELTDGEPGADEHPAAFVAIGVRKPARPGGPA